MDEFVTVEATGQVIKVAKQRISQFRLRARGREAHSECVSESAIEKEEREREREEEMRRIGGQMRQDSEALKRAE